MACVDVAERGLPRAVPLADQGKVETVSMEAVDLERIMQEVSLKFPGRDNNITGLLGHLIGESVFVLQGMAGTGKTSILRALVGQMQMQAVEVCCSRVYKANTIFDDILKALAALTSDTPVKSCKGGSAMADFVHQLIELAPFEKRQVCIIVDHVEYIAMLDDICTLAKAHHMSGYNINATIVLVTSASWCLGTYHLSLPLLPVERFRQYTPEELLQVLKKHPPSQYFDETQWERFITRYLNPFYWKSRLVPGLIDIMHQAYACYTQPVQDGKLSITDQEALGMAFRPQWQRMSRDFAPGSFDETWNFGNPWDGVELDTDTMVLAVALYAAAWSSKRMEQDVLYDIQPKAKKTKSELRRQKLLKKDLGLDKEKALRIAPHAVSEEILMSYFKIYKQYQNLADPAYKPSGTEALPPEPEALTVLAFSCGRMTTEEYEAEREKRGKKGKKSKAKSTDPIQAANVIVERGSSQGDIAGTRQAANGTERDSTPADPDSMQETTNGVQRDSSQAHPSGTSQDASVPQRNSTKADNASRSQDAAGNQAAAAGKENAKKSPDDDYSFYGPLMLTPAELETGKKAIRAALKSQLILQDIVGGKTIYFSRIRTVTARDLASRLRLTPFEEYFTYIK